MRIKKFTLLTTSNDIWINTSRIVYIRWNPNDKFSTLSVDQGTGELERIDVKGMPGDLAR